MSIPVYNGVAFDEEDGSPTFDIQMRNITVTQVGYIAYSGINAFVSYLLAPTVAYGTLMGVFAGAGFPDNSNFRVVGIKITPFGQITGADVNGVNTYDNAKIVITYSNLVSQISNQDPTPWLQHQWDIGGEFLTFNGTNCAWYSDGASPGPNVAAGILIPTTEMTITWPRLVVPPFSAIRSLIGYCNIANFSFDTGTATPETLLFLGAKVTRDTMSDGTLGWQFQYKFSEKIVPAADSAQQTALYGSSVPGGWNHFFRNDGAVTAGFYRMTAFGGYNIYQRGDFTPLFRSGP